MRFNWIFGLMLLAIILGGFFIIMFTNGNLSKITWDEFVNIVTSKGYGVLNVVDDTHPMPYLEITEKSKFFHNAIRFNLFPENTFD